MTCNAPSPIKPLSKISYTIISAFFCISVGTPSGFSAPFKGNAPGRLSRVSTCRASRWRQWIAPAKPLTHAISSPTSVMCAERSIAVTWSAPARAANIASSPEPEPASITEHGRRRESKTGGFGDPSSFRKGNALFSEKTFARFTRPTAHAIARSYASLRPASLSMS